MSNISRDEILDTLNKILVKYKITSLNPSEPIFSCSQEFNFYIIDIWTELIQEWALISNRGIHTEEKITKWFQELIDNEIKPPKNATFEFKYQYYDEVGSTTDLITRYVRT